MKKERHMKRSKNLLRLFLLLSLTLLSACGGSGGNNGPTTTTLKGAVEFPAANASAKTTAKLVTEDDIAVEVYDLNGKKVATVHPQYDDAQTTRLYSYEVPGLKPKVDYVLKAKKSSTGQVIKKLIEKEKVVVGTVEGQKVDPVSTTAVVMAEKKLASTLGLAATIKLGEENISLPAAVSAGIISETIRTAVQPSTLESQISTLATGGVSSIDSQAKADLMNSYLIVNEAIKQKIDAQDFMAGTSTQVITNIQIIVYSTSPVLAPASSMVSAAAATTISTASESYTPPAPTTTTTGLTAAEYVTIATAYLNKQDIANASINYENALVADPANKDANFGGAITSGLMLMEDADVKSIVSKWGGVLPTVNQMVQGTSPIKLPFGNMTSIGGSAAAPLFKSTAKTVASTSSAQDVLAAFKALQGKLPQQKTGFKSLAKQLNLVPTTAPTVSEMQSVIDNVIIPRVDKILARLVKVEGNGYTFTVTKAMQGNPVNGQDVTLNDGEFYTLDAALNLFQVLLKIATAYNFDIPSPYNYNTIGQDPLAMINGINSATVFTLKNDGAAKMAGALTNAKDAAAKAKSAYDTVTLRTAGAGAFDLTNWTQQKKNDFTATLADITASLQGAKAWIIGGKSVTIDATKFFNNPLTRANLPTFGYDVPRDATLSVKYNSAVAAERTVTDYYNYISTTNSYGTKLEAIPSGILPTSDLPDYTLNGLLPGNTYDNNVAGFNGILPMLSGKVLTGSVDDYPWNFATDGSAIYYLSYQGNTGTHTIKKIDTATGIVSPIASGTGNIGSLLWYNGGLYSFSGTSQYNSQTGAWSYATTISPVTVTGSTFTVGSPVWTSPSSSNYIYSVASNGTDIYYAVSTWNQLTWTTSTDVRKLSNLSTDVSLITIPDSVESLSFQNGFLYTAGEKRDPAKSYSVVASYANSNSVIMVGGYFYKVYDGKLVKYAGTPGGGVAKLTALLGKFF